MKTKLFKLSCLSLLFFALPVHAENTDIVVSEIAAYESNGCEWIEISNKGSDPINIDGWRFWEQDTNHRLNISSSSIQTDWNIDPGEYAIIAQNDTTLFSDECGGYVPPAGTVFDSSWGSLRESGELIGLKDADGSIVEEFISIAAPNGSLERVDLTLSDYTSANWTEQIGTHTFGTAFSKPSSTPDILTYVQLVLRYEDTFVFDDRVPLTPSTSSVLTVLQTADATSTAFSLSDVVYYESFDSYLVNCIEIATSSPINACYNWNYIVNGAHPQVGMDDYALAADDVVYVYFSTPWRLSMPTTTVFAGTTTTFETWAYQYDNLAEPWAHDPDTQVTVSAPNPSPTGWWDAMLPVTTTVSDALGIGTVTMTATGTFSASITAPDFSKWSAPVTFTVLDLPPIETTTTTTSTVEDAVPPPTDNGGNSGGSGGGGGGSQEPSFDVPAAFAFLASAQQADGSFGSALYTDWTAVAYGAADGTSDAEERLKAYLLANPAAGALLTDLERRAMALMALGINPYNGTATDYIQAILASSTNGQFGEEELFNDDIFAFFPLFDAGVSATDPRIVSSTAFILSFQDANGSWGSVDMTAAAVQALSLVPEFPGVPDALTRARTYLLGQQQANGGFNSDPFASSWAMQALVALGITPNEDFLASIQLPNGSVSTTMLNPNNPIWATSYAIPAALEKSWNAILVSFSPPQTAAQQSSASENNNSGGTGGFFIPPQPEELATSTTSTPIIAPEPIVLPTSSQNLQLDSVLPEPPPAIVNVPAPQPTIVEITAAAAPLPTTTPETTTTVIEPFDPNTSTQSTAQNVFKGSAAMTTILGLYLVWRFFRTLI